jgi:hypothetical protein
MPVQDYRTVWPGPLSRYLRGGASVAPTPPGPSPLIEWLDPAPSTPIARDQAITVRITDANLELAVLSARFASIGVEEVVWRDGAFAARYASSGLVIAGAARTFTIRRTGGWPASVRLAVDAVDADGQVGSE